MRNSICLEAFRRIESRIGFRFRSFWWSFKDFFLNNSIPPLVSWRFYGFFSWDLYFWQWPMGSAYKGRIHFAVFKFNFRKWKFEAPGGASGTRIGVDWGDSGWQIGYDNGWKDIEDQNRWIITRFGWHSSYIYKILPWTWHPFWYPKYPKAK